MDEIQTIYAGSFQYEPWSQKILVASTPHQVADILWKEKNDPALLLVRGWGGLSKALGNKQAAAAQDAFGRRVAELLNTQGLGEELKGLLHHHPATKGGE